MIIRYLRGRNKQNLRDPYGVVVIKDGHVGWSMCYKGDRFNKKLGRHIATERATVNTSATMPRDIANMVSYLKDKYNLQ